MTRISILTAFTLLLTAAAHIHAQGRARGGLRQGNVAGVQLLLIDEVQAELKLSAEQKKKADAVHEEFMKARREIFAAVDKESGERGPKVKELKEKTAAKLDEALDGAQRKRLREIVLQVNGAAELENEEVAKELKISDEQKKQLAEVRKANGKARRQAQKDEADPKKMAELQAAADKKLLEVLTPEQQKQFTEMQGKKIELKLFDA